MAKRNLHEGEIVDDIGGPDIFGRIYTHADARSLRAIPIGIATGGQVLHGIAKGQPLTSADFRPVATTFVNKLRDQQDALLTTEQHGTMAGAINRD